MIGRVHSLQTLGAVDGPGLRAVVFLQGCPLRCVYCHNPDTWDASGGEALSSSEVAEKILRLKGFYKNGGVTVSGGEPLLQGEFVEALFGELKAAGLHTALDTSGIGSKAMIDRALNYTDLVLCDIKFSTEAAYANHARGSLERVRAFLKTTEERSIPVWIRHVVVPGLTDSNESALAIRRIASEFQNIQKIELLPFKNICETKYRKMGIPFPLSGTPACPKETIQRLEQLIANEKND